MNINEQVQYYTEELKTLQADITKSKVLHEEGKLTDVEYFGELIKTLAAITEIDEKMDKLRAKM